MTSSLAAALGGLPPPGPGGPPPGLGPGAGPPLVPGRPRAGNPETYSNSLDALDDAEHAMHAYVRLEPDEVDRAAGTKLLAGIVGLKAKDQKDRQAGGANALARALGGGGGPGPGGPPPPGLLPPPGVGPLG
jgi:hypothetical protein